MPHLEGLGRLVACDLIGMGASDKLDDSGPDRYHYAEQRDYLFALWDSLDLGDRVIFVLHDWGSALGFDWANQHRDRVAGIAYMEAIAMPSRLGRIGPIPGRRVFQGFRSPEGEAMVLEQEHLRRACAARLHPAPAHRRGDGPLPRAVPQSRRGSSADACRGRATSRSRASRPTSSPSSRSTEPGCRESDVPKLFVNADPGSIVRGRVRDFVRTWPNQTEVTVPGVHFIQEDSPDEIGASRRRILPRSAVVGVLVVSGRSRGYDQATDCSPRAMTSRSLDSPADVGALEFGRVFVYGMAPKSTRPASSAVTAAKLDTTS